MRTVAAIQKYGSLGSNLPFAAQSANVGFVEMDFSPRGCGNLTDMRLAILWGSAALSAPSNLIRHDGQFGQMLTRVTPGSGSGPQAAGHLLDHLRIQRGFDLQTCF